ncbi:MAG: ABC transporter substrate-binding protein [Roseateles asaccharophilus]|uniref:ABC-type transport system substrate-binding protein n=1 Tax=Roseateles asaccharophilus TaxID=582607 RepID=A0A4R6MYS3_9BURK|nr:ABC transporter substrate-binding protein [Roseateles asaccharophilus]MDN3545397.1 ABC transporter substrate-binding protein [Roseateles asaccharophilus]TDP07777.1 ABC-type transport system substrate-binding protein [Roseateles asaccharophilus]
MQRRQLLLSAALGVGTGLWPDAQAAASVPASGVLRLAFKAAETGFDPARISDGYSRAVTGHIFEALYGYDHLARPVKIQPLTAAALPEISADFRTFTIRLRPGIYFAEDPAFKGRRRELVAADYVYSFKRIADPAWMSPMLPFVLTAGMIGMDELRAAALAGAPFDYDREIEGLRALDRYTLQIRCRAPRPRLLERLASSDIFGAVAREVVETYGRDVDAHPVGTGPFRLAAWRRSSRIVLEKNPQYRERFYTGEPAADDAEGQALLKRFAGRRLPLVERVEIAIIEEDQPRWLSFLNGELDVMAAPGDGVPAAFIPHAIQHGQLAPQLQKRGIRLHRQLNADCSLYFFGMTHPVIGGLEPEKIALRRAISLGIDVERNISLLRRGQGVPAQSPIVPHTSGYDPAFKSEMSSFDPARARALLDAYGYKDRDGDGWRERPDGQPLTLEIATTPDSGARQADELWRINMHRLGLRVKFLPAKFPEHLKAARAGKLMIWGFAVQSDVPDGLAALARYNGAQAGSQNVSRFALPAFDAVYERLEALPDGPEREALFLQAKRLAVAYAPYKITAHLLSNDLTQPWVSGYRRPLFWSDWWQYVEVGQLS